MKRMYVFLMLLLLAGARLSAVPVTVSGQLLFDDGTVPTDWPVFIGGSDPATPGDIAFTDAAGFYSIVVDLPAGDSVVLVQTFDHCNQSPLLEYALITNNAASADFTLCSQVSWPDCWANGWYQLQQDLQVHFFGEAYGADSLATFTYAWDFGDGSTSTEQNPTHTYASAGQYTVTLTATSGDCSSTITLLVDVFPVQNVTVSGHVTDQNGANVPSWFVFVETGDPVAPIFAYTDNQGFYSVTAGLPLSATTVTANTWDFCSPNGLTATAPIVNGAATIDFQICYDSFPPFPDCGASIKYAQTDSLTFQFTAETYAADPLATFSYNWDFGDGNTSTEESPAHTYAQAGMYSVLLTVTTSDSCIAHACEVVCTFSPVDTFYYGCQAMFAASWGGDPNTGNFDPLTLTFYDMSFGAATSWHWDFGDGATDTVQNPTHTYAQDGLYTVTLTITAANGCESTISMDVYAGEFTWTEYDCQAMFLPVPDSSGNGFLFIDLSLAPSPIQSWQWQFGDGTSSNEQYPYHQYAQPGVYTVSLSITADSCNSMISFELDTNDPFHVFRPGGGVLGLASGTTSVDPDPVVKQLNVFPNPATAELTLAFNAGEAREMELLVHNLSGQAVYRQALEANAGANALRVPVQTLTPGLYMLQLRTEKGVQTVKFVKE